MRLLLDNNVHVDFLRGQPDLKVSHCRDFGWQKLTNGQLVSSADARFDVLVTVDKNMRHQTSLKGLSLAVVVLDARNNTLEELLRFVPALIDQLPNLVPGAYIVLPPPSLG